ncbi:MAG: sulfatase, partial [bacterium]
MKLRIFYLILLLQGLNFNVHAARKPNVIFILADDLGRHDISFYGKGANGVRTPHIDGIFREGVSFTNFYSNSPVCSPTRAALMTGLYPDHAGVPGVIRQNPADSWGYL